MMCGTVNSATCCETEKVHWLGQRWHASLNSLGRDMGSPFLSGAAVSIRDSLAVQSPEAAAPLAR